MKKFFYSVLASVLMTVGFVSCSDPVQEAIDETNKDLPAQVAEGFTATSCERSGNSVVLNFSVDEDVLPMEFLEASSDELKKGIIEDIKSNSDPDELEKVVKEKKMDLVYLYKGVNTGKEVRIELKNGEF